MEIISLLYLHHGQVMPIKINRNFLKLAFPPSSIDKLLQIVYLLCFPYLQSTESDSHRRQ